MEAIEPKANWKKYLGIGIQVAMDFKVMGLIALNLMLLYMGLWDTVMRPNLEQIQGRDKALEEQKKSLQEREGIQKQYSTLEQQLKSLDTDLAKIPEGNSAKVVSVTEAAEILELAKGNLRDVKILPLLLPPHDKRGNVSLTPISNGKLDLLRPDEGDISAGSATAGGQTVGGPSPSIMGSSVGPDATPVLGNGPMPGGGPNGISMPAQVIQVGSATLPVERFDYELKVTGTYPALMDVLNELVIRKKLVKVNKVTISRSTEADSQPDARDNPEFPVPLDMVVSLSMLLSPLSNAGQP